MHSGGQSPMDNNEWIGRKGINEVMIPWKERENCFIAIE